MNDIDEILNRQLKKEQTPSVQYLLFDHNEILYRYRAGLADVSKKKKVDDRTTCNVFSVTKTFTALAVMQLAEQGKVDIDKCAANYIAHFPYPEDITVRQLLSHTAGIPNPNPLPWIHPADEHRVFDRDKFFRPVFEKHNKVKSIPNKKFAYSNLGYVLLGQLIEEVAGMKYEAYIEEYVLKPLGLSKAQIGFEDQDPAQKAKGYNKKNSLMNWVIGIFIDKKEFMGAGIGSVIMFNRSGMTNENFLDKLDKFYFEEHPSNHPVNHPRG